MAYTGPRSRGQTGYVTGKWQAPKDKAGRGSRRSGPLRGIWGLRLHLLGRHLAHPQPAGPWVAWLCSSPATRLRPSQAGVTSLRAGGPRVLSFITGALLTGLECPPSLTHFEGLSPLVMVNTLDAGPDTDTLDRGGLGLSDPSPMVHKYKQKQHR